MTVTTPAPSLEASRAGRPGPGLFSSLRARLTALVLVALVKPVDFEQFSEAVRHVGLYWVLLNQPPGA